MSQNRKDYWEGRTERADRSRSHPDDTAHRIEIRDIIRAVWRASGLRGFHWSFESSDRNDWKASSIQRWANSTQLTVDFVFEGLAVPEELRNAPPNESASEQIIRAKRTLRHLRQAKGVSSTEMDRRLDQQVSVYSQWEARYSDFQLSAMQRVVRALGGTFKIELEHKHNPGMLKRLMRK